MVDVERRAVSLSGELGSGKSSVAELLGDALGARRISTGAAQRQIAEQRGVSTLELNRLAETDPSIDDEIDAVFRSLAGVGEPLIVDSRLAWHFLPDSFKVHLVVEPSVGASRVHSRQGARAERYETTEEALEMIERRVRSERRRFQVLYGVDIFLLRNYDLVVDTSEASPGQVAERVLAAYAGGPTAGGPTLYLAPSRIGSAPSTGREADPRDDAPLRVTYRRPRFTTADAEVLGVAVARGAALVPAVLEDEVVASDDG